MRTPKTLKIAEIQARRIAVDWESLGYNITRCHTFNVTICYHYFRGHNESKADCLDMDPKAPQHVVNHLPPYTNVSLKMILTNPEGRKESEETIIQTDEDGTLTLFSIVYQSLLDEQVASQGNCAFPNDNDWFSGCQPVNGCKFSKAILYLHFETPQNK